MASGSSDLTAVQQILADFPDPETGRSAQQLEQISEVKLDDGRLSLRLGLTTHSALLWDEVRADLERRLRDKCPQIQEITIEVVEHVRPPEKLGQIGLTAKSVIAIGSGKGGVGKSTIAATVALGLARAGSKVGLVDADVYGPSIPHLLGIDAKPVVENNKMQPLEVAGLKVMSMGFLVPPGEAVVWRGPMLHQALTQFLRDVEWGDLDYLIIDMPPGTGDIALSLSQLLPLTGSVVVCTPQDVALLDAVKAVAMFRKVNIPVLGLVENMSYFECPDCNKRHDIFGHGGAQRRAAELEIPFLGELPINMQIRIRGDQGKTAENFDDAAAEPILQSICENLVRNLSAKQQQEPKLPTLSVLG